MEKTCIFCGQPLPEQASFCHHCARSQLSKTPVVMPRRRSSHLVPLCVLGLSSVLLLFGLLMPRLSADTDTTPAASESSVRMEEPAETTAPETTTEAATSETTPSLDGIASVSDFPASIQMPAPAFSVPDAVLAKVNALPVEAFDRDAIIAAAEEVRSRAISEDITIDRFAYESENRALFFLGNQLLAQASACPNGNMEYVLYHDFGKNIWAWHLLEYTDGTLIETYYYTDGAPAIECSFTPERNTFTEVGFRPDRSQAYYLLLQENMQNLQIFLSDGSGSVVVNTSISGTEYFTLDASAAMTSRTVYVPDGSVQEYIYEDGNIVRSTQWDAQGNVIS